MKNELAIDREQALGLLRTMLLVRSAELRLARVFREVGLPGPVHLSIGQEGVAAGVCSELGDADQVVSTHRGHGHFLAKGGDINTLFAEIWGKRTGVCQGMGGSMHIADLKKGIIGANGIVGGGIAIATGAALAARLDGRQQVVVCFFGDGAANQGVLMESMNIASIWTLPIVFVCENNGVAEFTLSSTVTAGKLADRARPFMPIAEVDGNDTLAVIAATRESICRARAGLGPGFIEAKTYRTYGHVEGEDLFLGGGAYRTQAEVALWQTDERDPISRFLRLVLDAALITDDDVAALEAEIGKAVEQAVAFAEGSEPADTSLVFDLFA